jgi:type II secretory pathway pseudopilin PulG
MSIFTLVELMVSVALVASVVSMATGAYLIMIALNREAQAQATGINNLSHSLESMVRTIRSGTNYVSAGGAGCVAGTALQVSNPDGITTTTYCRELSGTRGRITQNGVALTDPTIDITQLRFVPSGFSETDTTQANVKIVISGKVNVGAGKDRDFWIETWAAMRGIDL